MATWEDAPGRDLHPIVNPATGEPIAQVPYANAEDVDRAARAAHAAFLKWREMPVVERVQVFYRYKDLLEKHAAEIARILSTENGKTRRRRRRQRAPRHPNGGSRLRHAQPDDGPFARKCLEGHRLPEHPPAAGRLRRHHAVQLSRPWCPMWMFPFAIACGNTFILKPSEKVPLTPTRTAELLHDAALPAGVFNLLHGAREAVDALLAHPLVRAISFVGSSPVAKHVYQTAAAHGKRVQALGGAKNHLVAMPDAHIEKSVEAIMGSAFGAAGERCLAGSVLVRWANRAAAGYAARKSARSAHRRRRRARHGDGAAGHGGSPRRVCWAISRKAWRKAPGCWWMAARAWTATPADVSWVRRYSTA